MWNCCSSARHLFWFFFVYGIFSFQANSKVPYTAGRSKKPWTCPVNTWCKTSFQTASLSLMMWVIILCTCIILERAGGGSFSLEIPKRSWKCQKISSSLVNRICCDIPFVIFQNYRAFLEFRSPPFKNVHFRVSSTFQPLSLPNSYHNLNKKNTFLCWMNTKNKIKCS